MKIIELLENLAKEVRYSPKKTGLIKKQALDIQEAFDSHNHLLINNQFENVGYLANGTGCVKLD